MSLRTRRLLSVCSALILGAPSVALAQVKPSEKIPDPGVPVEMFESANLDTFLRNAQGFLGKEEYHLAIQVLQAIVEGRTGDFVDAEQEKARKAEEEAKAEEERKAALKNRGRIPAPAVHELPIDDDNPAYSVFSSDDRIYRPVKRLCHELLASMPAEGIGLYRVKYESVANQRYEAAVAQSDLTSLESVYNEFFVTLAAARAMRDAAELQMDAGRFRAAIQTLNTLLEVYPEPSRREAGIRDLLLMVKVAVCYQQLGEFDLVRDQLAATIRLFPDASVRLMGELHTVKDLPSDPLFSAAAVSVAEAARTAVTLDLTQVATLSPLWEFRYTVMEPYKSKKRVSQNRRVSMGGKPIHGTYFPYLNKHVPGTTVQFSGDSLVFMDSFRPLVQELNSGRQQMALGGADLATFHQPANNAVPGPRIPTYDYFANRVAMDQHRYYAIRGFTRSVSATSMFRALEENELTAYDRGTGEVVWTLDSKQNRRRPITFLATPTVHRAVLLLPFLDAGSYGLMCLDSATGHEVYRTYLHYKGTAFNRAPAPPVVVESGAAFVLTNAGILASVDANTGALNWSNKYSRVHPTRGHRIKQSSNRNVRAMGFGNYVVPTQYSFRGFAPTDLTVVGDRIILAAVDSTVLECVSAATSETLWVHNAARPDQHSVWTEPMQTVVGHCGDRVFVMCGYSQLLCIHIKTGVRQWMVSVPGLENGEQPGRGCVAGDYVVLPGRVGTRRIHVVSARAEKQPEVHTIELPAFSIGDEPLSGPVNLFLHGSYLALTYAGGVEVYSTEQALSNLAAKGESAAVKASFLIHAGKLSEAAEILLGELGRSDLTAAERDRISIRALSLVGDLSAAMAEKKDVAGALALLERCEKIMRGARHIRRVHLFRLQVYRAIGDVEGIEREQEFIESGASK